MPSETQARITINKTVFQMRERFGSFPWDGEVANAFRFTEVEPALVQGAEVIFDFAGVTNMTSSFCNALVATLVSRHPNECARQVRFANCDPVIREFILAAIALGRRTPCEYA